MMKISLGAVLANLETPSKGFKNILSIFKPFITGEDFLFENGK